MPRCYAAGDILFSLRFEVVHGFDLLINMTDFTRLRRKPWPPGRGGMRVSSEALAPVLRSSPATEDGKEGLSFGGLRRTKGATGSSARGASLAFARMPRAAARGGSAFAKASAR